MAPSVPGRRHRFPRSLATAIRCRRSMATSAAGLRVYRNFADSCDRTPGLNSLPVSPAIAFLATCPQCRCEQLQDRFTAADLMRLLYGGYPVEAYCDFCDEFCTVSIQKRVELGEIVAAVCAHVPPSAGPELKINH